MMTAEEARGALTPQQVDGELVTVSEKVTIWRLRLPVCVQHLRFRRRRRDLHPRAAQGLQDARLHAHQGRARRDHRRALEESCSRRV